MTKRSPTRDSSGDLRPDSMQLSDLRDIGLHPDRRCRALRVDVELLADSEARADARDGYPSRSERKVFGHGSPSRLPFVEEDESDGAGRLCVLGLLNIRACAPLD